MATGLRYPAGSVKSATSVSASTSPSAGVADCRRTRFIPLSALAWLSQADVVTALQVRTDAAPLLPQPVGRAIVTEKAMLGRVIIIYLKLIIIGLLSVFLSLDPGKNQLGIVFSSRTRLPQGQGARRQG